MRDMKEVDIIKKVVAYLVAVLTSLNYFIQTSAAAELVSHNADGFGTYTVSSYTLAGIRPWLTVYSYEYQKETFHLLFGGNEGVLINWHVLLIKLAGTVTLGAVIGLAVWVLITYCVDKWLDKKPDKY